MRVHSSPEGIASPSEALSRYSSYLAGLDEGDDWLPDLYESFGLQWGVVYAPDSNPSAPHSLEAELRARDQRLGRMGFRDTDLTIELEGTANIVVVDLFAMDFPFTPNSFQTFELGGIQLDFYPPQSIASFKHDCRSHDPDNMWDLTPKVDLQ